MTFAHLSPILDDSLKDWCYHIDHLNFIILVMYGEFLRFYHQKI